MRQTQRVVVYGVPRGKGRPRFTRRGSTYTDAVTTEYEGRVKKAWICENNFSFDKAPTTISIKAFFPVPVSLSKKKRAALFGKPYLGKPDADNIAKIILDALLDERTHLMRRVAFKDDAQVDTLTVQKLYVNSDEELPRVEIEVMGGEE